MNTLSSKVAIIIGASKGIGVGVAEAFLLKDAKVVMSARTESDLEERSKELQCKTGRDVDYKTVDITDREQLDELVQYTTNKYGRVDILCQNAGIYPATLIEDMSVNEWRQVVDTNLTGTFNAIQAALPVMKQQQYGRMVITSSITGVRVGNPRLGHYGASKAGINGLVKTAAIEFAKHNITINCVEPGNIFTEALEDLGPDYIKNQERAIPMGYLGSALDIGFVEAFLASDEAKYITGQSFVVDGGQTLPESQYDIL